VGGDDVLRIYADFNHVDEKGRLMLDTVGSLRDIARLGQQMSDGMTVILYMTDELEVEATVSFDGIWVGVPDFSTVRYYNEHQ
jgi:hypothetical protein